MCDGLDLVGYPRERIDAKHQLKGFRLLQVVDAEQGAQPRQRRDD